MKTIGEYKRGTKVLKWIAVILFILIIILCIWYRVLIKRNEEYHTQAREKYKNNPSQPVELFNSKFEGYQGIQNGSVIRDLYSSIEVSNARSEHIVKINGDNADNFKFSNINRDSRYNVKVEYDCEMYIDNVIIQELQGIL